ncbi:uncharacterized protein LOC132198774 [Neocloeon triangulifer]|uniref:uncharacterized protein LOC132198774 n=1 Tax=Neocloeon triangulifer TaxID=2078957 RepID=UPI00286EC603|nr:uncharacterized protein LOC132198774 [Neocloeon triangulifer]
MAGSCSSLRNMLVACALLAVIAVLLSPSEARYLPTRGQDDRLDRLRELLKDLLEGDMERGVNPAPNAYDKRYFFKREVGAAEGLVDKHFDDQNSKERLLMPH